VKDRGSATVWVLACVMALSAGAGLALAVGFVAVERQRAASVADQAALAAAAEAVKGEVVACASARRLAQASQAAVVGCRMQADGSVLLEVELPLSGPLAGLPAVRVRSRAGPPGAR
jgi:secretion/DNA translocation related TadE-like protein